MFLLGLIAAVCYIPGYTGASIPTQWALFSIALPFFIWRSPFPANALPLAVLAIWAFLGLAWSESPWDGVYELWIIGLWIMLFILGASAPDLRPLWRGLAIGLIASSAIAAAQALGYGPVLTAAGTKPSGLLFNSVMLGAVSAIVLVALVAHRLWLYIPGILPALALSQSRGAIGVAALVLLARRTHWSISVILGLLAAIYITGHISPLSSDDDRLNIWVMAWTHSTAIGLGPGSFNALYFIAHDRLFHPEFAHNDALQLWFAYGPVAIAPAALVLWAAFKRQPDRWPLITALALGLFWFPIYAPLSALATFACAGHLLRGHDFRRALRQLRRSHFLRWAPHRRRLAHSFRRGSLPVQPRT